MGPALAMNIVVGRLNEPGGCLVFADAAIEVNELEAAERQEEEAKACNLGCPSHFDSCEVGS